jgi:hypothetical protein
MCRHTIGTDRAGKLDIPQNSNDFEEIHLSFVGVYFGEIVKVSSDVAHMDLMYLPSFMQVPEDYVAFAIFWPQNLRRSPDSAAIYLGHAGPL